MSLALFAAAASLQASQTVTLAWDRTVNASGYMIYTSADGVNFNAPIDAGNTATVTLSGLKEGATNFFYVTAYDPTHIESAPSATVSYLVPGGVAMSAKAGLHSPATVNFSVVPGHSYQIQASVDLVHWTTVHTVTPAANQWVSYQDPLGANLKMRFYRVLSN